MPVIESPQALLDPAPVDHNVALLIARQREEAATWSRVSQELYLEYDRLVTESTHTREQLESRVALLEERLQATTENLAQVYSKLSYREAQAAKLKRSFLFTFFSLKFTVKQVIKLLLTRLRLRLAPDPTDYLAGDD
jgi:hypothetical protein